MTAKLPLAAASRRLRGLKSVKPLGRPRKHPRPPEQLWLPLVRLCRRGHPRTPDTVNASGHCRICRTLYNRVRTPHLGTWAAVRRRAVYGLTPRQYEALVLAAQGRCDLCGRQDDNSRAFGLVIDHHHASGGLRGLLCEPCNVVLGYVEAGLLRPDWFGLATAYLARPARPLRVPVLGSQGRVPLTVKWVRRKTAKTTKIAH